MRANEIMIGDYLKTFTQKIVKVKEIKQSCIYTEDNGYEYNELEPIPLTPEILEKNGFYFGYTSSTEDSINNITHDYPILLPDKTWCYDEGDGEITVEFPNECDGGAIHVTYSDKYIEMLFDNCIYVHQLQHALRLCEIEKEIIL